MLSKKYDLLFLTLFLSLIFGLFLGTRPLMTPDEGRYAEIPREMVESGDYLTPHLNYIKYFEKPALFYWLEAASIKLFGMNEWALRAVVSILSLLGCLMVYIAGLKLYDRRTGILACLMLATSILYFSMSRFVITDMPLTVFITASLLLFILGANEPIRSKRYYFWGMYACSALAVMTKGLVGAVFPGMIIFAWLCVTREWKQLKTYCLPTGILLFLLIAAPWHILVQLKNPEFFKFYFIDQHFMRYLTDYAGRQQAWWFFPVITLGGLFPWVCFLIPLLITGFVGWIRCVFHHATVLNPNNKKFNTNYIVDCLKNGGLREYYNFTGSRGKTFHGTSSNPPYARHTLFFALWAVILFVFYSLSKSQLLAYALPIMPPVALLLARYFSLHWQEKSNLNLCIGFGLITIGGILMSVGGIIALHFHAVSLSILIYAGIAVLLIGTLTSSLLYWRRGIQAGLIALIVTVSASFIIGDIAYPSIDTRSIKPLAVILKPQLKPHTEVASYHEYYQDLPAYLARRVILVQYQGELAFGIAHQATSSWVLDEKAFWQRWRKKPKMFMIMSKQDYATLKKQGAKPLPLVGQTAQDVLLTNFP